MPFEWHLNIFRITIVLADHMKEWWCSANRNRSPFWAMQSSQFVSNDQCVYRVHLICLTTNYDWANRQCSREGRMQSGSFLQVSLHFFSFVHLRLLLAASIWMSNGSHYLNGIHIVYMESHSKCLDQWLWATCDCIMLSTSSIFRKWIFITDNLHEMEEIWLFVAVLCSQIDDSPIKTKPILGSQFRLTHSNAYVCLCERVFALYALRYATALFVRLFVQKLEF